MTPVYVEGMGQGGVGVPPSAPAQGERLVQRVSYRGGALPEPPHDVGVDAREAPARPFDLQAPGRRMTAAERSTILAADAALALLETGASEGPVTTDLSLEEGVRGILSGLATPALAPEECELTACLSRILPALVREAGPNLRLRVAPTGQSLPARIDAAALERALVHLVRNASAASDPGGEIRISWGAVHSPRMEPGSPPVARIRVEDRGRGVPSRYLPWLFTPFFTLREGAGRWTGIGLPLVRTVAEGHGGWVEFTSGPGAGTVVDLLLPLLSEPGAEAHHAAAVPGPEGPADPVEGATPDAPPSGGVQEVAAGVEVDSPGVLPVAEVHAGRLLFGLVERALLRRGYRVAGPRRGHGRREGKEGSTPAAGLLVVERGAAAPSEAIRVVEDWLRRHRDAPVLVLDWNAEEEEPRMPAGVQVLRRPFDPERIVSAVESALSRGGTRPH